MTRGFLKKNRGLVIAAAVLIALVAAYVAVTLIQGPFASGYLYSLKKGEQIESVTIKNSYGVFEFTRDGDRWYVSDGAQYRASKEKMELILSALSQFKVERELESALPEYGLDEPSAVIKFITSEGKTYGFMLGTSAADSSQTYVKDAVSGAVIVTDAASTAQMKGSIVAYRDKDIFTIDINSVRRIDYYKNRELSVSVYNQTTSAWFMSYPYKAPARQIELNELYATIMGWTIAGYPEQGKTLSQMGLDEPDETIVIYDSTGAYQAIELGAVEGTARYARIDGSDDIVMLYQADVDFSVMEADKLVFIAPLKAAMEDVRSISVTYAGVTYTFGYDAATELCTYSDRYIDYEDFVRVYYKYISLVASGKDVLNIPAGELVASFETVYANGATAELELYARDADTLYMMVDGETVYYLNAEKLTGLLERIALIAGVE